MDVAGHEIRQLTAAATCEPQLRRWAGGLSRHLRHHSHRGAEFYSNLRERRYLT